MDKTKKVLSYIWRSTKKYRWYYLLGLILYALVALIHIAYIPLEIKEITNALSSNNFALAKSAACRLGFLYLIYRVSLIGTFFVISFTESKVRMKIDNDSYGIFTSKSYDFYASQFTGSLVDKMKRLGRNSVSITDSIVFNLIDILIAITATIYLFYRESLTLAVVFLVFVVLYSILIAFVSKKVSPLYEKRSEAKANLSSIASDIITNIQTVMYFSSYEEESGRFNKSNIEHESAQRKAWFNSILYQDITGSLPQLFIFLTTLYAINLATRGLMEVGSVVLIFILGMNISRQLMYIAQTMKGFTSDVSDCVESIEIIEEKIDVLDPIEPEDLKNGDGEIVIKNLSFTYPKGEHVFKGLNLNIKAGTSVGFVGKSGSGKTTITKLLLRLYDIDSGIIKIDNQDISKITQSDLRSKIAYIPQETILFHRSIYENIAYGNPRASKEEVMRIAVLAHVDEFAKGLEKGYETLVGERGVKLSGGQRQRIGIARALLRKDSPLLIMDEATSALDSKSENLIQSSFDDLSRNRTTLVIAHRLSTIKKLDRIIVLDKGEILEDGSHDELLNLNGHYADLWQTQREEKQDLI